MLPLISSTISRRPLIWRVARQILETGSAAGSRFFMTTAIRGFYPSECPRRNMSPGIICVSLIFLIAMRRSSLSLTQFWKNRWDGTKLGEITADEVSALYFKFLHHPDCSARNRARLLSFTCDSGHHRAYMKSNSHLFQAPHPSRTMP